MKRVFGFFEMGFDLIYLISAGVMSVILLTVCSGEARVLAGIMAGVLVIGDAFHLVPRIKFIVTGKENLVYLGVGKLVTSVTMTVFYLILWQIGLLVYQVSTPITYILYLLAVIRIVLCFLPQNAWCTRYPPQKWAIIRNAPFFIMGVIVAILFFINRHTLPSFEYAYLAICASFLFYLPVVLWVNKNPKIGMLMLPKTCCYLWILTMCLSL